MGQEVSIKVGDVCKVERRVAWASKDSKPEHVWITKVTKVTPKRVYLHGPDRWFSLNDPTREVRPRYLDYRSHVVEITSEDGE